MTFPVVKFTAGFTGPVAHVADYRFANVKRQDGTRTAYKVWSISADGYDIISEYEGDRTAEYQRNLDDWE